MSTEHQEEKIHSKKGNGRHKLVILLVLLFVVIVLVLVLVSCFRDYCYMRLAVLKSDVSLCEKSEENSDRCYDWYARGKDYPDTCSRIVDDALRYSCYQYFANKGGDPSYCGYVEDDEARDKCIEAVEGKGE